MLEKLDYEQEVLMRTVRDEWLDLMFDWQKRKKIDQKEIEEDIKWLYTFSGITPPKKVTIAKGLNEYIWASVRDSVGASVGASVWDSVWASVRASVWASVRDSVGASVRDSVWDSVWASVRDSVRDSVWDSVWASVRDSVWASVRDSVGDVTDWSWVSFYQYFSKIGIVRNSDFDHFVKLCRHGIFFIRLGSEECVICPLPSYINYTTRNSVRILHDETGPAISWRDGYRLWFLYGVKFEEDLWKKVISKQMSFKDIISLENMEQRMAALKVYGPEAILEQSGAKQVSKSKRGNELYLVKDVFPTDQYCLKYTCPSTGRVYVSFVPPDVGAKGDADAAMAWKYQLLPTEYAELAVEA